MSEKLSDVITERNSEIRELEEENANLRAQVAQLTLERDGCRDLIATLRNRVAEGESRVKELEGAIRATGEKVRTGIHCRWVDHHNWCCDCKKISAEYDALLTEASAPPAEGAEDNKEDQ